MNKTWMGFEGRVFLTDEEHATYLRRPPVRYAAKGMSDKPTECDICGLPERPLNTLQASHLIPFTSGWRDFWLTPDYLDQRENLVWAHKKGCNKGAELSFADIAYRVRALRVG